MHSNHDAAVNIFLCWGHDIFIHSKIRQSSKTQQTGSDWPWKAAFEEKSLSISVPMGAGSIVQKNLQSIFGPLPPF